MVTVMTNPRQYKIPDWFLNRQKDIKDGRYSQVLSNALDNKLREDLERLKKIRAHRGLRHYWGWALFFGNAFVNVLTCQIALIVDCWSGSLRAYCISRRGQISYLLLQKNQGCKCFPFRVCTGYGILEKLWNFRFGGKNACFHKKNGGGEIRPDFKTFQCLSLN